MTSLNADYCAVQANREAPALEFKSNKDEVVRSSTTAALAAKFTPDNDMEEEVAELLRAAGAHTGEAVEEAEEALALKVSHGCCCCLCFCVNVFLSLT